MSSLDTSKLNSKRQEILKGVKKVRLKKTIDVLLDAYEDNTALNQIIEDQENQLKKLKADSKGKKVLKSEPKKASFSENDVGTIEALTSLTNMYSSQVKDLLEMKVIKQVSILKLEENIENLQISLASEKESVVELKVRIDNLEAEKVTFLSESEQTSEKIAGAAADILGLKAEVDTKNDQITTVIATNEKLKKDIERLKNPMDEVQEEVIAADTESSSEAAMEH
jgi:chromosome segregation ATPase